jgi:hypothetical protein
MGILNWFFRKKLTLNIYMKSGNVIEIKCDKFECSRLSGDGAKSLTIDGADCTWSIDIGEVEAIICKK